jgi:transposase/transposase-like protein
MTPKDRDIQRKLKILKHAEETGHVGRTCRYFGVGRASFYRWKATLEKHGEAALVRKKPIPKNPKNRTPPEIVEKVLHLRKTYHLGPMRIVWYLARYHDIKISGAGVSRILKRNGLNRLPRGTRLRKVHTTRYQQQVPGHQIQVDVKFLIFRGKDGKPIKRYQYTAIDDATRVRALKVYSRHTQANAIDFLDYVIKSFPFRIREVRTDNGHEFQAKFHWHVEDHGIRHAYIKPRSPQLNGKVERSHRASQKPFPTFPLWASTSSASGNLASCSCSSAIRVAISGTSRRSSRLASGSGSAAPAWLGPRRQKQSGGKC